jgi:hypothetical protein
VIRPATENPRWAYLRPVGEARKLQVAVPGSSVRTILIAGRALGPLFIGTRRPGPAKEIDARAPCPDTGGARLSSMGGILADFAYRLLLA